MTERKKADADKIEQHTQVEVAQSDVVEANTQPIICGLIMPIAANDAGSAEHWSQVRTIIEDALKNTELKVQMVSESDDVNVIHHNIVTNIYSNDIVICDVSSRNPNVMFELGVRLTFDKPVVIVKDRETPFSFDVGNIQHLEYPRSLNYIEIQKFQDELKFKVLSTLTASKMKGYSPFLSHYKIKHLAKIDTEEVGKEDFIISSLNEMKAQIKLLTTKSLNYNYALTKASNVREFQGHNSKVVASAFPLATIGDDICRRLTDKFGDHLVNENIVSLCDEVLSIEHPYMGTSARSAITDYVINNIFK